MTAAQVVRSSTRNRSTRSTRGENTGTKDAHTQRTALTRKREHRSRPSTRGIQATGAAGGQKPRRTASTRNGSAGRTISPSTRVRASTRPAPTRTGKETTKKSEPFNVKEFVFNNIIKRPEKPEEVVTPEPVKSRATVYGHKREVKRNTAPLQFLVAMFFVVVISVVAFGLLRGEPVAQQPDRPEVHQNQEVIYEKPGTTSTNTGILRGSGN